MSHYAVQFFLCPTSEIDTTALSEPWGFLQSFSEVWTARNNQSACRQPLPVITLSVTESGGREFFFHPAGVLCTLLAGPLVPHPSAGRPSHCLILPVPRWLLVGAMWLSSNEPPGINRSSSPRRRRGRESSKKKLTDLSDREVWGDWLSLWAPNQWRTVLTVMKDEVR